MLKQSVQLGCFNSLLSPTLLRKCLGALSLVDWSKQTSNKYAFQLPDATSINHLVVFLTGAAPFPPGYAATVHFLWPSSTNQTWTLLGHISNEKPSAIFKLGGKRAIPQIKPMDSTMEDTEASRASLQLLLQFSGSLPSGGMALFGMDWGSTFIPLQALQNWYTNVQKRIKTDPGFLK
ncbi:hypothetical protein BASA81_017264 [Batrachochytrium salamandrivorans]|nr:hypothetical protein BASA81_017264 [Batrachochytrium salamandrivorans]